MIIHRDLDLLLGAKVPFRGLDGAVTEQELDLLEVAAALAAELGAGTTVMPHAALSSLCRMPDNAESKSKATHNPG
jgi:hypothetical protein